MTQDRSITYLDEHELDLYSANTATIYPAKLEMIRGMRDDLATLDDNQVIAKYALKWCGWLRQALVHYDRELNTTAFCRNRVIQSVALNQMRQEIEEIKLGNWADL